MQLRHLRYFVSLAQERHFRRAAEASNITQSTLSAALRQLEDETGAALIVRDSRFRDLTVEGQTFLNRARRIISEHDTLDQELAALRHGLTGHLRIGVVPTALPTISLVTAPFSQRYGDVTMQIVSCASDEVHRAIETFELDAGVTYLEGDLVESMRTLSFYEERYILLTPADGPFGGAEKAAWRALAETPLCLLTADMQNRRIIDRTLAAVGVTPNVQVETDSLLALCSHIRARTWSSVLPQNFLWLFGIPRGMVALPLEDPVLSNPIGLVTRDREPETPVVRAFHAMCQEIDMTRHYWGRAPRRA